MMREVIRRDEAAARRGFSMPVGASPTTDLVRTEVSRPSRAELEANHRQMKSRSMVWKPPEHLTSFNSHSSGNKVNHLPGTALAATV